MPQSLRLVLILSAAPVLALGVVAPRTHPQPGCIHATAENRYNQRLFRSLMRRKDKIAERFLSAYKVPRVSVLQVQPVIDPVVCRRAAVAYGRAINENEPGRKVHILRVGDRYIVMDPAYVVDNHHRAVTFDSTLTKAVALIAE
jgi:hypothetical protein